MAKFVKGDVVVVPFPFSDLTQSKKRPALVLAPLVGRDLILCQITSRPIKDSYTLSLNDTDFETGALRVKSNIRPNRIFTADEAIIAYKIGRLSVAKVADVVDAVIKIIRSA